MYNYRANLVMEFTAYLIASIAIAAYLDKKSKAGNVSFSILFTVVSFFYMAISQRFLSYLPSDGYLYAFLVSMRGAVEANYGLASAGAIVRFVMMAVVVIASALALYQVGTVVLAFVEKHFPSILVRTYLFGKIPHFPNFDSSNVVGRSAPLAKTRTYLKLGVLRN